MTEAATRVVIVGGAGRMGQALVRGLMDHRVPGLALAGAVDLVTVPGQGEDLGVLAGRPPVGVCLGNDLHSVIPAGDVFIDFSFHSGIEERLRVLADAGKSVVVGTTGLSAAESDALRVLSARMPILYAANMSLGVNLLAALVEQAAARLRGQGYDIEITEAHHRKKLDAPSGTALFLGEAAARGSGWTLDEVKRDGRSGVAKGARPEQEIGFHAVRGGDIVGDHTVLFAAEGELLELSHRATCRDTFANGALRAAAWLAGKPCGLYGMNDVLGLR